MTTTTAAKLAPRVEILIDGFWAGEFGEVEFTELALEAGMTIEQIGQVIADVREEDGTI